MRETGCGKDGCLLGYRRKLDLVGRMFRMDVMDLKKLLCRQAFKNRVGMHDSACSTLAPPFFKNVIV